MRTEAQHVRVEDIREPVDFREVAIEMQKLHGKRISYQRCQQLCEKAVKKLRIGLMRDPVVARLARQYEIAEDA